MYNYYSDNNDVYFSNSKYYLNPFLYSNGLRFPDPIDFPPPPLPPLQYPYTNSYNRSSRGDNLNQDVNVVEKVKSRANPLDNINKNIINLNNNSRTLWLEHVYWIRFLIVSILNNLKDVRSNSQRLLKNASDIETLFSRYYSPDTSRRIGALLREHLLITTDLINAIKKNDDRTVLLLETKWNKNADELAQLLASINPHWNEKDLKDLLHKHLELLKSEIIALNSQKYEDSIRIFNDIQNHALRIADTFTNGIIQQFPSKF